MVLLTAATNDRAVANYSIPMMYNSNTIAMGVSDALLIGHFTLITEDK